MPYPRRYALCATLLTLFASAPVGAQISLPPTATPTDGFRAEILQTNFVQPTSIAMLPDGRYFVAEQYSGDISVVTQQGARAIAGAPGLMDSADYLRGMMGIAVDPQWPARPYLYACYTFAPPHNVRVSMFTVTGDLTVPSSVNLALGAEYAILADIPDQNPDHNGGCLRFGPDGMLYVSTGDDTSSCTAQDIGSLNGKILRLDVSGLPLAGAGPPPKSLITPPGNPYPMASANARLVWASGLRNPFRFSIDSVSGALYVADVGQDTYEEVSEITTGGQNLGWPHYEGNGPHAAAGACTGWHPAPTLTSPIFAIAHPYALSLLTFGRYRNPAGGAEFSFGPEYEGDLFFGDYMYGLVCRGRRTGSQWDYVASAGTPLYPGIWALGLYAVVDAQIGPDGAIYYVQRDLGQIGRLIPGPVHPGNGADLSIGVLVNGALERRARGIHVVQPGTTLGLRFSTPLGTHAGAPFAAAIDALPMGHARPALMLPGDAAPSLWIDWHAASLLVDGFSTGGAAPGPVLGAAGLGVGPLAIPATLPPLGLSMVVQMVAYAPGWNAVNLAVSDACELLVP
jgi:glucose/arabinose dehydrogenase